MDFKPLCQCCLLAPPDYDLKKAYPGSPQNEIFSNVLKECFGIEALFNVNQSFQGICNVCAGKLRESFNFKQQLIECQNQLTERNTVNEFPIMIQEMIKVKAEILDLEVRDGRVQDDPDDNCYDVPSETPELESLNKEIRFVQKMGKKILVPERKSTKRSHDADNPDVVSSRMPDLELLNRHMRVLYKMGSFCLDKKRKATKRLQNADNANGSESRESPQQNLSNKIEIMQYKEDLEKILKYSNCTPFFNKTKAGIACAYCRELYKDIEALRKHTGESHNDDEIESNGADRDDLSVNLDINNLKCNICNTNAHFIADLKKHLTDEHSIHFFSMMDYFLEFKLTNSSLMSCVLCHSDFETFTMLLQHMNGHYRNYECIMCDLGFINMHRLKVHEKIHDVANFKCSLCDMAFNTRVRLRGHEKHAHSPEPQSTTNCSQCDLSFTSYYHRNRHMTVEHDIVAAPYVCSICNMSFILKSKLTAHVKNMHLNERNYICAQCGLAFFTQHALHDHMLEHNGERVFKCPICNKAYARKNTLMEHKLTHYNDRRFECGMCSSVFEQKRILKSHMLSNHGISLSAFLNSRI